MLTVEDIERSEKVFNALGEKLAEAYHPAEFTIRAFVETRGWVRKGPPVYAESTGTFVIAEINPANAAPYRFIIQREDALDAGTHSSVLAFIESHDFSEFERADGKKYCYQFTPQPGEGLGQTRQWETGKLGVDTVANGSTASSFAKIPS